MNDTPNLVRIAALIGDFARAEALSALMAGQALTVTELANRAGVTKQTISGHLSKLLEGGLLACEQQGRHRYYRLASTEVAQVLEALMGLSQQTATPHQQVGPRQPALRKARTCYDHLAGELAVVAYDAMLSRQLLSKQDDAITLTDRGLDWLAQSGIDTAQMTGRRPLSRPCLDWSERRHHLAGKLGRAMLVHVLDQGWATRAPESRVVSFSAPGERDFRAWILFE
ncbi:ArsR family transcriptional regulator [Burkholderiaceae bacterium DAT-1]|nr:ArsR family transcriptional regulator [Burkholderiaceae bacterium DAT-1]